MSMWAKWMIAPLLWLPLAVLASGIDFTLKDMQGQDRHLREFIGQGKWTVVAVWESSCSICKMRKVSECVRTATNSS